MIIATKRAMTALIDLCCSDTKAQAELKEFMDMPDAEQDKVIDSAIKRVAGSPALFSVEE